MYDLYRHVLTEQIPTILSINLILLIILTLKSTTFERGVYYGFLEMFYLPCSMEHQFMSKNLCSVIHINFKMFYVPCSMEDQFIF